MTVPAGTDCPSCGNIAPSGCERCNGVGRVTVKGAAVIVVNLPTVSREEYEWALDQIERAATGSWEPDIARHVHGSWDEAVAARVMSAFFPDPREADGA